MSAKKREKAIKSGMSNPLCHSNSIKQISLKTCRNNCKQYDRIKKKCKQNIK